MITKSQRKQRRHHLGASDSASLYGLNDYQNAYELWMKKVYSLKDQEPTEAMKMGNELEPLIVKWIADKLKLEVDTNPKNLYYTYEKNPLFACNLDARVLNYPTAVEAKYSGNEQEWGYNGSEEQNAIPGMYYIQVQHQLLCTGLQYIIVAVWLSSYHGFDKRYYYIKRDESIIDNLIKVGEKWWAKHVAPALESDTPEQFAPKSSPANSIDIFKRIERVPGKVAEIRLETYLEYSDADRAFKEAKKRKDETYQALLAEIGNAEAGQVPGGKMFTFKEENSRKNIDFDILKLKHPDIYEKMVKQGKRKVFRETKNGGH